MQRNLELFKDKVTSAFGGSLHKSHPKKARPLSTQQGMHLILKSGVATGRRSLLHPKNAKAVESIIRKQAKKFGVRLFHLVNVGGHAHLVLALPRVSMPAAKKAYHAAGDMGRAYKILPRYMEKNRTEALSILIDRGYDVAWPLPSAASNSFCAWLNVRRVHE